VEEQQTAGLATLIDAEVIGGYTVKPWTLGNLREFAPLLPKLIAALQAGGIRGLDDVEKNPMALLVIAAEHVPAVIALTLRIPVVKAEEIPLDAATLIALTIVRQNLAYIRKLLGPAVALLQRASAEATASGPSSGQQNG
jgi:ABC-type branched-subunit amino acid transport system permease subunit